LEKAQRSQLLAVLEAGVSREDVRHGPPFSAHGHLPARPRNAPAASQRPRSTALDSRHSIASTHAGQIATSLDGRRSDRRSPRRTRARSPRCTGTPVGSPQPWNTCGPARRAR